jgi:hypothetical protein
LGGVPHLLRRYPLDLQDLLGQSGQPY